MVAQILRLRLTLLANTFRHPSRSITLTLFLLVIGVGVAVGLAWMPRGLSGGDSELLAYLDTITSTIVLGVALVLPVFWNRSQLDPRHFGFAPVSSAQIALGMLVSTVLGWPFFCVLTWLLALIAFHPEWWEQPGALVLGIFCVLVFAALAMRLASAASKLIFASERAADLRGTMGTILTVAMLPLLFFAVTSTIGGDLKQSAADVSAVAGWTPLGSPISGIDFAVAGEGSEALSRFGVSVISIAVMVALWILVVRTTLRRIDRPVAIGLARSGLGWFERFSARPSSLIGARTVTYWLRDPRYRVALVAIPVAPIVMVFALMIAGVPNEAIALIPLPIVCLLLAWSIHNDVATDATAIWIHVASGTRGLDDRLGRLVPVLLIGIPVVLIGSSLTVAAFGDWRPLPAVIGMSAAVLMVGCGVASVSSVLSPYPTTRPGDSPFVQPQWSGSGSGLTQTVSMAAALLLSLPPVFVAIMAITDATLVEQIWALLFCLGYGFVVAFIGVYVGGKIFDRNSPELIAIAQMFD